MREKQKRLFNFVRLGGKYVFFFLQNSFLAIIMLSSRKLVQGRGNGEKCCFSLLAGRHQRVKITPLERDLDAQ